MMKKWPVVIGGVVLATIAYISIALSDQLGWRAQVVAMKAAGQLDFLSWSETLRWIRPDSPVYLSNVLEGLNPHTGITSARSSNAEALLAARQLYQERCAGCHGLAGEGAAGGPSLIAGSAGRSDWSTYQILKTGVPGTSMQPQKLSDNEAWGVVAYVASLTVDTDDWPAGLDSSFRGPSFRRIANWQSEVDDWLTYSGGYSGWRHSALDDIDSDNVNQLALKWVYQSDTTYDRVQASPIVVDGMMFISEPPGRIVALNAETGRSIWEFERKIPNDLVLCCGVVNRGVAVLDDLVFLTTIDAHLIALDIRTGRIEWETKVADYRAGYSITSAPLVIDRKVVTGVAGGETATRGFIAAFDARTGSQVWQFNTIPKPGEAGSDTWSNELWEIGGAATWMIGSYDPDLDLLFWGTSHTVHEPGTDQTLATKKLYGSSILALRGNTGELVWFFQFTPNDLHGFDAAQVPILVDIESADGIERLLVTANRNGFFYVLDRTDGRYILGRPFTKVTWASGLSEDGSPIVDPVYYPSPDGTLSWPSHVGGANWWPPAFAPNTNTLCVPVVDGPSVFFAQEARHRKGRPYVPVVGRQPLSHDWERFIRCMDVRTGVVQWEHKLGSAQSYMGEFVLAGLLHTGGDLIFGSDRSYLFALNARTGQELWRVNTGGNIVAPPVTYRAGGTQYVAVIGGRALLAFALPEASESVNQK